MIKVCSVHSRGWLLGSLSAENPELLTSWCSISRTVQTNALIDHGGFALWAAIDWSQRSLHTPAVQYMVNWRPFTTIWKYLHPTACFFWFVLLPVLWMIFKRESMVIFLVAALAVSWWNIWCPQCCSVLMSDVFDDAPANRLDLDPPSPGWGGYLSTICWCGIGEEDDNEKKWEVLRNIQ